MAIWALGRGLIELVVSADGRVTPISSIEAVEVHPLKATLAAMAAENRDKRMKTRTLNNKGQLPETPLLTGNCQERLNPEFNHVGTGAMPEKGKPRSLFRETRLAIPTLASRYAIHAGDTTPVRNT